MKEPEMTIEGQRLSEGEVMTLRVALASFVLELQRKDALGADEHGRGMVAGYTKCAQSVTAKMWRST